MEFRLLGPVVVEDDGRALSLGGRRQRAVLTYLLLHRGRSVGVPELIEQVWGDDPPAAVRASVHTYVSRLRGALGDERLETRNQGYLLQAADDEVDAVVLERHLGRARRVVDDPSAAAREIESALGLVRGPALGDLADEPSLRPEAARLDGLVAAAHREWIAARLRLGHHAALVPELADLLGRDPLQEDLWCQYVLALYRSGRQADALAAYERARAVLREDLGIEPSPPLRELHARVLRQDEQLTLAATAVRGYRLVGVLGEGPSAVVHRAVQPGTGRHVALKALHPWMADDPEPTADFTAEAEAALALEHPNVVPLHDFWREAGGAYLVMRLMRGGTLEERLARGPVPVAAVVRLAEQVSGALDCLAERRRATLNSGDVLLDEEGNAYLSGFCLARRRTPVVSSTSLPPDGGPGVSGTALLGGLLRDLLGRLPEATAALTVAERAAAGGFADSGELLSELRRSLAVDVPTPRAPPEERAARNPYKGLRAFEEADAPDFFGRSEFVARLAARLSEGGPDGEQRFLAVVGPSGCGKSSAVRAGLVPALRSGAVPGVRRWHVVDLTPRVDPFAALEQALHRLAAVPPPAGTADRLRRHPTRVGQEIGALLPDDGELLLLVDQLEELFTLAGDSDRRAFLDALVAAALPDSRVRVVVTLRADFYDRPLSHPAFAELLRQGTEVMVPLTPEGIEQAVVEPATGVGLAVEPALLAQVVADVGEAPGSLPLLQYALTELADHRRSRVLTLAGYRELGGVGGALVRRADAVHRVLTGAEQAVARQVMLQLVHPTPSGVDTRRRVLQQELEERTGDPGTARRVLAALGEARLLAFDRDPATGAPTVEVAHEALLREWGLLRGWLDTARDDLRAQSRLTAAAREWDDAGRDAAFLAAGRRLEAVETWAARQVLSSGWAPSPVEREYLDASRHARDHAEEQERRRHDHERALERRSVRRLRAAALVLAAAVLGVSVLTVYGFSQRDRAERESLVSRARALAGASAASIADDPERAMLLALEAVRTTRDADGTVLPEAEEALHSAVTAHRGLLTRPGIGGAVDWSAAGLLVTEGPEDSGLVELRSDVTGEVVRSYPGHDTDVNDVAFSPDGTRLMTTGDDGAARLWDPATGRLVWELEATGEVWAPTFSGDGRRVAASWRDEGVIRVFDVAGGKPVGELRSVPDPWTTALTHDGAWVVATGAIDSAAEVRDVATGALVRTVQPGGRTGDEVDVSPDGRWLVTGGADSRAHLWSVDDGSLHGVLHMTAPVTDVDWSRDSERVVVGAEDGVVRVFEVAGEAPREVVRLSSTVLRGVFGVAFSPDGRRVLLGDLDVRAAQVYDVGVGGSREWWTDSVPSDFAGAGFTAGGTKMAASAVPGGVVFRDADGGGSPRTTDPARGVVAELRTSPDDTRVAGAVEGAVVAWGADGDEAFSVPVEGWFWGFTWSPDSSLLAFTTGERLMLVDRDGAPAAGPPDRGPNDGVDAVAFSPDGRLLVTAHRRLDRTVTGTGHVEVFDRSSGRVVRRWVVDALRLAVSPDGRFVAAGTAGGDIEVHRLDSGERVHVLAGHTGRVWDLDFGSDGRLASAGQDATVRIWDVGSGQQTVVLRGHSSFVTTARFDPDARRLVTTSGDGTVRVWAVDLDDLIGMAESRATRELTDAECRRFLQSECR